MNYYSRLKAKTTTCACPTCGQILSDSELRIDLNANVLICDGVAIKITKRQAEVIWLLLKNYPNVTATDRILDTIWRDSDSTLLGLRSQVTYCRRILELIGWTIKSEHNIGYRLVHKIAARSTP